MISKLTIQNFKSLEDVTLECSNLNVLTGLNGMGKSSIIQALLLLRQSYDKGYLLKEGLSLNGDLVNIGSGKEALFEFANDEIITFGLEFEETGYKSDINWSFAYEKNSSVGVDIENRKFMDSDYLPFAESLKEQEQNKLELKKEEDLTKFSFFKPDSFRYLNADRWVRNEYDTSEYNVVRQRSLGKHGEFTAHYLNYFMYEQINTSFLHPSISDNQLLVQVSAWLSEITPKTRVIADKIKDANSVKLRFFFEDVGSSKEISPLNVGFGITYTLPIIVALLSSKPNDILIIENPEAHVHPGGQAMLGRLIAKVAKSGTQIFVETHSDHIINGILINIFKNSADIENGLSTDDLKINFIRRIDGKLSSENIPIKVQDNGRIKGMPEGFFDQYSKDMKTIIGF